MTEPLKVPPGFNPLPDVPDFYNCKTLDLPARTVMVFVQGKGKLSAQHTREEVLQLKNGQWALFHWTPSPTTDKILGIFSTFDEAHTALILLNSTRTL